MTIVTKILDTAMRTVKASEFKAKCLALMDEVQRTGQPLLVTKNGKPVAELHPHRLRSGTLFGAMKGRLEITGDILAPIDVVWDVEQ